MGFAFYIAIARAHIEDDYDTYAGCYNDPERILNSIKDQVVAEIHDICASMQVAVPPKQEVRPVPAEGPSAFLSFDGHVELSIPAINIPRPPAENAPDKKVEEPRAVIEPPVESDGPKTILGVHPRHIGALLWDDDFNRDRKAKGVSWEQLIGQGYDAVEEFALLLAIPHALYEVAEERGDAATLENLRSVGVNGLSYMSTDEIAKNLQP
jgi:hypothetical protein